MRTAFRLIAAALVLLLGVLVVRTVRFSTRQITPPPAEPLELDSAAVIQRLAEAIRLPTVSEEDSSRRDPNQLIGLHRLLEAGFPHVSNALTREVVDRYSLFYTWPGTDRLAPAVLFISHLDVVPADSARWSRMPFAGDVADGFVWGRGTLDDKVGVLGVLEAV